MTENTGSSPIALTLSLAECVLENDFVAAESKKVASSGRYRFPARIRRNKIPLKRPDVAGDPYFEIFEFPVRKAFEKRFDAISDFFLAAISLPKVVWSNGGVIDAVISEEACHKIRIAAVPC